MERYVRYEERDLKKKMMALNAAENLLLVPYCLRDKFTKTGSCDTDDISSDAETVGCSNDVPSLHENFSFTVDGTKVVDISADQAVQECNRLRGMNIQPEHRLMQYEWNDSYFRDSNDKVEYYTGLSSFATLITLFKFVACNISGPANQKLSNFQCFLITLMKLRLNLGFEDIGYRFSVDKSTVCRIFKQWIDYMYETEISHSLA